MDEVARFRLGREGVEVTASVRPHSLTLTIDFDCVYSFDLSGRLLSYFERGTFYRRGLDHSLIRKERREGEYSVERIPADEMEATYDRIFAPLKVVSRAWANGNFDLLGNESTIRNVQAVLSVMPSDPSALAVDTVLFHKVYSPVAILPPDQYLALVLQVTEGCSYNRCQFCRFYRDRPFRVKSLAEFQNHVDHVIDYFGPGLSVRKSVFLADANALVVEPSKLEPMIEAVRERFLVHSRAGFRPRGIFSFVDTFHTEFGNVEVWRRYRELGLRRVYMGVESGNDDLLAAMGKPATAAGTRAAARTLKSAGIQLGIIIITGLGGRVYDGRHVVDTTGLLNSLPLDRNDLLMFSPYNPEYAGADMEEFGPVLSSRECDLQRHQILAGTQYSGRSEGPRIATYNLKEFVY